MGVQIICTKVAINATPAQLSPHKGEEWTECARVPQHKSPKSLQYRSGCLISLFAERLRECIQQRPGEILQHRALSRRNQHICLHAGKNSFRQLRGNCVVIDQDARRIVELVGSRVLDCVSGDALHAAEDRGYLTGGEVWKPDL